MSEQNPQRLRKHDIHLHIMGNVLDPKLLTEMLGAVPDRCAKAGEPYVNAKGEPGIRKVGFWIVQADRNVNTVVGQVDSILERIQYSANIREAFPFISFAFLAINIDESWADDEFDGFAVTSVDVPPRQLQRLGELGITIRVTSTFALKYAISP